MTSGQRVVVIDGVRETAQVLREVFEPQGHCVERVRGFETADTEAARPGVLVVHEEGGTERSRRFKYGTTPRVVIGSLTTDDSDTADGPSGDHEQRLSQPFHYAELIRAVDRLLAEADGARKAA